MSDPHSVPQKPPFEETWQYQCLRSEWNRITNDAIADVQKSDVPASWKEVAISHLKTSTKAFDETIQAMRERYDRGEL